MTHYRSLLLALFALALVLGCRAEPSIVEELEEIPFPELESAEAEVRRQLETAQERWLEVLHDLDASAVEKGTESGRLGELYHAYDLLEAAAACYRNAKRLAPRESRWPYLLGVLHRFGADLEPAAENLRLSLELSPQSIAAGLHLALVEFDLGRFEVAEAEVRRVLSLDADNATAFTILGRISTQRGDHTSAVEAFERALELQPQANRLHYLLGQSYRRLGDLDAARQHLAEQGTQETSFEDPVMASLYTHLAGSAALMQRGASAKHAGLLDASVETYRRAVEGDPKSPEARRDLGALLAQVGRYEEAAVQYREAIRLEPAKALNHFVLALVVEQMGAGDEVVELMTKAVDLEPEYREFRFALAGRQARAGKFEVAREHFQELLEQDSEDAEVRLELAKSDLELGDLAASLREAQLVERQTPYDSIKAEAIAIAASVLARRGETERAKAELQRALDHQPDLASAHFSLGNLEGMAGNFKDAVSHYQVVIQKEPERTSAWIGAATGLALLGREDEAVQSLESGLQAVAEEDPLKFALSRLLLGSQDPSVRDPGQALALAQDLFQSRPSAEYGELLISALVETEQYSEAAALQRRLLSAIPPGEAPELARRWSATLDELARLAESTR